MDAVLEREEEMIWLAVFAAWMIWAHLGAGALKGTGMIAAMFIAGFAMHQFLNNFWKLEPDEGENPSAQAPRDRVDFRWRFGGAYFASLNNDQPNNPLGSWEDRLLKSVETRRKGLRPTEPY